MSVEDHAARVLDLVARIPPGRVLAYGDIAQRLGGLGPRTVGTVMSRYGSDVPWWRVIRSDGRPPQGLESEALEHWRAEGTPDGRRARRGRPRRHGHEPAGTDGARRPRPAGGPGARRPAPRRDLGRRTSRRPGASGAGCSSGSATTSATTGATAGRGSSARSTSSSRPAPTSRPGVTSARAPGVNHLAFHGGSRAEVDALVDGLRRGRLDADVRRPAPVCRWARSLRRLPRERGGLRGRARRSPGPSPRPARRQDLICSR